MKLVLVTHIQSSRIYLWTRFKKSYTSLQTHANPLKSFFLRTHELDDFYVVVATSWYLGTLLTMWGTRGQNNSLSLLYGLNVCACGRRNCVCVVGFVLCES